MVLLQSLTGQRSGSLRNIRTIHFISATFEGAANPNDDQFPTALAKKDFCL
jgi:hypothetical protein